MDFDDVKIGIVSLTVGHWDLMGPHIQSLYDTYPHPKEFFIVPNVDFGMSLSAAINRGFKRAINDGCDFIVYCADDVMAGHNSVQTLVEAMATNDVWMVNGQGANSSGWDFFGMNIEIFRRVGFWDESFYPAYFEDNSFARRLSMTDDTKYLYTPIQFEHIGSQTVKRMTEGQRQQHNNNFNRCAMLFETMWGGPVGKEVYTQAFNGEPWPEEFQGLKLKPPEFL